MGSSGGEESPDGEQNERTGRLFMATILEIYELVPVESSGCIFRVENV